MWVVSTAFALLAIIIPIAIQYFQNKSLKASERELEGILNLKIEEAKKEINNEMILTLESKLSTYEKKLQKDISNLNGQIMQLQANSFFDDRNYLDAFGDYCLAVSHYTYSDDVINLGRAIECIKKCLDYLTKEEILRLKTVENIDIVIILNELEEEKPTISAEMVRTVRDKLHDLDTQKGTK
ncbi:hypothetical protein [Flavobacterium sp. ASV13]|uniref:hypothetical protein n=1 Tax=Flavobacterium sp. ASV13 TaxID=1506583 RepID=UPI00054E028B|nr:hypothetical protein [Flavobacterium sp. ASV13]